MTLSADIAGDYTYFHGVEEVTVVTQPGSVETSGVPALQRPLNLSGSVAQAMSAETRQTVWNVWSTTLTIQPGDQIQDSDGTIWIVESSQQLTLKTRWRCICREAR